MKEKIAVHCPTKELWYKVQMKALDAGKSWNSSSRKFLSQDEFVKDASTVTLKDLPEICIAVYDSTMISNTRGKLTSGQHKRGKYTIISAADYLKEGEVEEPQARAAVECVKQEDIQEAICKMCEDEYSCNGSHPDSMCEGRWCDEMLDSYLDDHPEIKLNEKESNMKDNGIDSNVLAVFGDKVKGNELVVIDRHFTEQMITQIVMEVHHKEIQAACKDIEAKRLKEEAKK